jgi:hypothetical protein
MDNCDIKKLIYAIYGGILATSAATCIHKNKLDAPVVPTFFIGISSENFLYVSWLKAPVFIHPGEIEFTLIPNSPNSKAKLCVKPIRPAFALLWIVWP